jgi:HSP20 family protein
MTLLTSPSLISGRSSLFNDPFDEMQFPSFEMNKSFGQIPSANIIEVDNEFRIELAAPGMKKDEFKVEVNNGQLTISSVKKEEKEEIGKNYTRQEFSYKSFTRSFLLPENINTEKINAKYDDGILKLTLPKVETTKKISKKTITIG